MWVFPSADTGGFSFSKEFRNSWNWELILEFLISAASLSSIFTQYFSKYEETSNLGTKSCHSSYLECIYDCHLWRTAITFGVNLPAVLTACALASQSCSCWECKMVSFLNEAGLKNALNIIQCVPAVNGQLVHRRRL